MEDQNKIQKQEKPQIQNISMDYKIPKYLGGQWITPQMPKANGLQNFKMFRGTVSNSANAKGKL